MTAAPQSPVRTNDPAHVSGRPLAMLAALAVALGAAFVFAPRVLAASTRGGGFADQRSLVAALSKAFVEYWGSGRRELSPDLARLVDYWFRYHVAKALIAALLLVVLVALGVRLWRALLGVGGLGAGGRVALAAAWVLVLIFALVSAAAVAANIQGAIAPLSSLLSLLPFGAPGAPLAHTIDQVRQGLADYPNAGSRTPPAIGAMVSDFGLYHAVMAVLAPIVAVFLVGMSAVSWKRFAGVAAADRRTRRALGSLGALWALLSLAVIVVSVANIGTAADPAPALLAFFKGGW